MSTNKKLTIKSFFVDFLNGFVNQIISSPFGFFRQIICNSNFTIAKNLKLQNIKHFIKRKQSTDKSI